MGNMMKLLSSLMRTLILSGMIFLLLGCIENKTIQITPVQPVIPESPISTTSAVKVKVYNFLDARKGQLDPYLIGHNALTKFSTSDVKAAMGSVYNERPVFEIVTEAVKSEFTRNGYKIVQENEDFSVKGKINQFWVETPFKMMGLFIDAVGEVTLTMEVSRPGQKVVNTLGPYNGRKVERTIIPSPETFKQVLTGALMDAIREMSSDPNLINVLTKKQKNY
jgi:uncharacterized lipoprotein YajG